MIVFLGPGRFAYPTKSVAGPQSRCTSFANWNDVRLILCHTRENNVFTVLLLSQWAPTLEGKNLLLYEQISSFMGMTRCVRLTSSETLRRKAGRHFEKKWSKRLHLKLLNCCYTSIAGDRKFLQNIIQTEHGDLH